MDRFARNIAYLVRTPRLTLRCYEPSDAEPLRDLSARNKEHISSFLPWGREEPSTLDKKLGLIRGFRGRFDLGLDFVYAALDRTSGSLVGGCGLHPRTTVGATEIGYWIDQDRAGLGLATEMAAGLTRVAFEACGFERVEIRTMVDNKASARIALKLGFRHEGRLRSTMLWDEDDYRDLDVHAMIASDFEASPASEVEVEAFDALGRSAFRASR